MKIQMILAMLLSGLLGLDAAVALTGNTANKSNSMFVKSKPVVLEFSVSGLKSGEEQTLNLDIVDQHEKIVKKISVPVKADATGKWNGNVHAPNDRYGFYRVRGKLSGGVSLPKVGSRPAGCLTYAVLPDPNARILYPQEETFFGLHGNAGGDLRPWMGARWGGIGVYRSDEDYRRKQENRKKSNWPNWVGYGNVNYTFSSGPYSFWTKEQREKLQKRNMFSGKEGEKLYEAANKKMAEYGLRSKKEHKMMRYQPLWEPDLFHTNEEILTVYQAARKGLRAGDPEALVLGPCFHHIGRGSLERHENLFQMGFLDYVDEVTIHPYIRYPVEQNHFKENVRGLVSLVKKYGKGRSIPIRANESGYNAISTTSEELLQMNGQIRASLIMLGEGFASNEPFYGYDHGSGCTGDYGLTYNLMLPKQIWGPKFVAPRPVFPALAACSWILEGHKSTGCIEYLGSSVLGYSYADKKNHCVIALWDFGGENSVVEIPVGRNEIEVADLMGNRKTVRTDGGLLKIQLSESPIYLLNVDPALWGNNRVETILPSSKSTTAIVGTSVELKGTVRTPGELQLIFNSKMKMAPLTVKVGKEYSFRFSVPAKLANGTYPLTLKLLKDGRLISATGVVLDVKAPVESSRIRPMFLKGEPGFTFVLTDLTGKGCRGVAETRITGYPEARKRIPFQLNPGEKKELRIVFEGLDASPFVFLPASVRVVLNNGYQYNIRNTINFLPAVYLPGVGKNGDFSAWKNPKRYAADAKNAVRTLAQHRGPEDLSAFSAFGWNEEYLLFDIEVVDDIFLQPFTGWKIWSGDCLQFGFAKNREASDTANKYGVDMMLAFSEINFALTSKGAEANRTYTFDKKICKPGMIPDSELPRKFSVTRRADGKFRIHYQIAVPWKFINLDHVSAGSSVFWAGMVNDRDAAKEWDVSAIGMFLLKNAPPKYFGEIVLTR